MKLTPWYPPEVKPVRVGVYQRNLGEGSPTYSRWNGREWKFSRPTADEADEQTFRSLWQYMDWRGLAEPPK